MMGIKELITTLERDLKSIIFASIKDKKYLRKLEEDNQVLKHITNTISDILHTINEKLE